MSNAALKLEVFLATNGSGITQNLGTALIANMGGEDEFLSTYKSFDCSAMQCMENCESYDMNNVKFHKDNFDEIHDLITAMAESAGTHSVIEFIHSSIEQDLDYDANLDVIAKCHFGVKLGFNNDDFAIIYDWIIWACTNQLCLAFDADFDIIELDAG